MHVFFGSRPGQKVTVAKNSKKDYGFRQPKAEYFSKTPVTPEQY